MGRGDNRKTRKVIQKRSQKRKKSRLKIAAEKVRAARKA
jgi:hypothetical protein